MPETPQEGRGEEQRVAGVHRFPARRGELGLVAQRPEEFEERAASPEELVVPLAEPFDEAFFNAAVDLALRKFQTLEERGTA